MKSNKELVEHLIGRGVLKTPVIIEAFLSVDRIDFVRENYKDQAYGDYPLPIGFSQTISQPYTVAFMLELLQPQSNSIVLDVGCGSCYTTALLASIVKEGKVIATEIIKELVEFCKSNLKKYNFSNVEVYHADKIPEGYAEFDRILVSASASRLPNTLTNALKDGGVMVIPIQHSIFLIKKQNGLLYSEEFPGFAFVRLQ